MLLIVLNSFVVLSPAFIIFILRRNSTRTPNSARRIRCQATTALQLPLGPSASSLTHNLPSFIPSSLTAVQSAWVQDVGALAFTLVGSLVWVKMFRELTHRGVLDQKLSRKLVHITSGVLYIFGWALFSDGEYARYMAASVPMLNAIRLVVLGFGIVQDEAAVNSISREGDPGELLRGPLFYVLIMSLFTVAFWRDSAVGIAALSMMCGGDGLADIFGRRFGKVHKLPFNTAKSWAGSMAMFFGGLGLSMGFVVFYSFLGYMPTMVPSVMFAKLSLVALVGTLVESLPANRFVDDNLSVPFVSLLAGCALL